MLDVQTVNINPSVRSRVTAAVFSRTVRVAGDLAEPRGVQLALLRRFADGVPVRRELIRVGASRGVWVATPPPATAPGVILYLHGGGLVFGSPRSHYGLAKRLSAASGCDVYLLDYRLAPEHRFPAAPDDVLAAYRGLLGQGYSPARIAIAGDSAGVTLTAALLNDIKTQGLPMPAAAVMLSPAFEVGFAAASARDKQTRDPLLSPQYGRQCFEAYLGDEDPSHPRINTLGSDKCGWPPVLIQAGGTECLLADAELMAYSLQSVGVACELQVWPGQVHVFQALARFVPEARMAIGYVGDFLRSKVDSAAGGRARRSS